MHFFFTTAMYMIVFAEQKFIFKWFFGTWIDNLWQWHFSVQSNDDAMVETDDDGTKSTVWEILNKKSAKILENLGWSNTKI